MINIGIIGIGGVGGYLASILASYYKNNTEVRIHLFARGETYLRIKENGLVLKSNQLDGNIITKDFDLYNEDDKSPIMDYLFVCVKSYSIEFIINRISSAINSSTTIIPFLNGFSGRDLLVKTFPDIFILDACVYILSRIESPGVILENGNKGMIKYLYGSSTSNSDVRVKKLNDILEPFTDFVNPDNITMEVWTKFLRISTSSTIQTYYNMSNGQVLENEKVKQEFIELLNEFIHVSKSLGINFHDDIIERYLSVVEKIPYDMTCSLQRDYYSGKTSEVDNLIGFIPTKANELGIETPVYSRMYKKLQGSS